MFSYSAFRISRESPNKKVLWLYLARPPHVQVPSAMAHNERDGSLPWEPAEFTAPVLARLTVHVAEANVSKKKTTKKEVRTKEFSFTFCSTKTNYVQLLNMILEKHHVGGRARTTERRHFSCKIQVPPAKCVDRTQFLLRN